MFNPITFFYGKWTMEPQPIPCPTCKQSVHMMTRRGVRILPNGHKCAGKEAQDDQIMTIKAIATVCEIGLAEIKQRLSGALRSAGVN